MFPPDSCKGIFSDVPFGENNIQPASLNPSGPTPEDFPSPSGTPVTKLPFELIHYFIRFIARYPEYIRSTIPACALMCKQWHTVTRPFIFRSINIKGPDHPTRLKTLLEVSPEIGPYMRELTVFESGSPYVIRKFFVQGPDGSNFPNLHTLSLTHLRGWSEEETMTFVHEDQHVLWSRLAEFTSLRTLHLNNCRFINVPTIYGMLTSLPQLENIYFSPWWCMNLHEPYDREITNALSLPKLHTFAIGIEPTTVYPDMISVVAAHVLSSTTDGIKRLILDMSHQACTPTMMDVLHHPKVFRSLEHLDIRFNQYDQTSVTIQDRLVNIHHFTFSPLNNLHSLAIIDSMLHSTFFPEKVSFPVLEKVYVRIEGETGLAVPARYFGIVEKFDRGFRNGNLPALKEIWMIVPDMGSRAVCWVVKDAFREFAGLGKMVRMSDEYTLNGWR